MRITILIIIILGCLLSSVLAARADITDAFNNLLTPKRNLTYRVINGYEDIDKFMPGETASVYYSLWECSTRNFSDHSTPLIFYLSGGPGRSSQQAAYREFGPIEIQYVNGNATAKENPWSWNYYAHLIFVDQPVGTGFSYNRGKIVDNSNLVASHFINFLTNFMKNNGYGLETNPYIYLAGEGYAGHYIPTIFKAINTLKDFPFKIEGVILGGGWVDPQRQINHYQSFLAATGIVSQKRRNITNQNTNEGIIKIKNKQFSSVRPWIQQIWSVDASNKYYNGIDVHNYKYYTEDLEGKDYEKFLIENKKLLKVIPDNVTFLPYNPAINTAFSQDMFRSVIESFQYMLSSGKKILLFNGQNDLSVNPAGVLSYLQNLEWPGAKEWRESKKQIWKQSGRISGWVKKSDNLIFAILKNTGHYIYQDQTISDRSVYLMLGYYLSKKW